VDDLDFGIKDVAFAQKYSISMTLLMEVWMGSWKIQAIQCVLWFVKHGSFDHNHLEGEITSYKNAWTTFAIGIYLTMECFGIKSKSKRGFEKGDIHIITISW
jgi:hypothetical protein